jgi:hypothetical protein
MLTGGFSPQGFVVRAVILGMLFAICQALGWREHTTFLSGTAASPGADANTSALLGLIYMASYFGVVLLAPILLIAAVLFFGIDRWLARQRR